MRGKVALRPFISSTMLATLFFGMHGAHAADIKVFSAGICNVITGEFPELDQFGRMLNRAGGGEALLVSCPLVRDVPDLKLTRVEVSVVDNNPSSGQDFRCRVHNVNRFGTTASGGSFVSTSGANSAGQTLNLPLPRLNHVDGPYVVTCTIPPRIESAKSHIASIKLTEP